MTSPNSSHDTVDPLRAEDILHEVLFEPADTREAAMERLCAGDVALLTEVKSLLQHLPDPENPDDASANASEIALEGRMIGGCRIESLLGRGGTGRVFRAMQEWPPRPVAVKVLRPELLGEGARRRFRREARALARLDHPGIARILSAGLHREGQIELPFVVMEVVDDAQSLTTWWRTTRRSLAERLELFASICDAVHHGHVRGLVHRDLKPSNVLVGGDDRARVIDFSVASMTADDGGMLTLTRAIAGTPGYMAPEQFEGGAAVDLRTDVHALGLLLYECLAGRPAFARDGLSLASAARLITSESVPALGSIDPALAGDLEVIVSHAIEKTPADRYQSALELAADIRRHLSGHPISAQPATLVKRALLFARRNPVAVAALAVATLAITLGSVASIAFGIRESRAASRAEQALASTERALWLSRLAEFGRAVESGDAAGSRLSAITLAKDSSWPVRLLRRLADESLAHFDRKFRGEFFNIMGGAVSPDGGTVAMVSDSGVGVPLLDASNLRMLRVLEPMISGWAIGFDPVQGRLLCASGTRLFVWNRPWEGSPRTIDLPFDYGDGLAPSPDGTRVALSSQGNACIIEIDSGKVLARTTDVAGTTSRVAWSPDGAWIAIGVEPRTVRLLRATDLSEVARIPTPPLRTLALDFDPSSRWLAFGGDSRFIRVVEVANPASMREFKTDHAVWGLRWHPDGTRLAFVDRGSGVRQLAVPADGAPLRLIGSYAGHRAEVWWVEWNRAGDRLYSFGQVETRAWKDRPRLGPPRVELGSPGLLLKRNDAGEVHAMTADASIWRIGDGTHPERIWSGGPFQAISAAAHPQSDRWAWIDVDGNLRIGHPSGDSVADLRLEGFFDIPNRMAFSPSGRLLAINGKHPKDPLVLVDPFTGREVTRLAMSWDRAPSGLLWLDERTLLAGSFGVGHFVQRQEDGTWKTVRIIPGNWINPRRVSEGSVMVTSMSGELVEVSLETGEHVRVYRGLSDMAAASCTSPDESLLAAVGTDRRLHVFDLGTRDQLISLLGHPAGRMVNSVEFSSDGQRVFTLDLGGGLVSWDATPLPGPASQDQ